MLTHLVLITVSADATEAQVERMIAGLRALPAQVDAIDAYEVGRDMGLAEGNATVVIQATFASPDALRAYVDHPAHQAVVVDLIRPIAATISRAQVARD